MYILIIIIIDIKSIYNNIYKIQPQSLNIDMYVYIYKGEHK